MKIKIKKEKTVKERKEKKILKHAIIPAWCGGVMCAIFEDDINEENIIVFQVPYHLEYAHQSCFIKNQILNE